MKQKTCRQCKCKFTPSRPMQAVCDWKCAAEKAKADREKRERNEARAKKPGLRPLTWYHSKARSACHAYIRERDKHLPCISCGTTAAVQYAAGHYRPSGVNSALRYDEMNIHKQCNRRCNMGLSGNLTMYRIGLIAKLGEAVVVELEQNHDKFRWTRESLLEVEAHYKEKLKQLGISHDTASHQSEDNGQKSGCKP